MPIYTISQLAKCVNVTTDTIRYYERMRLLPDPKRSVNGYRRYKQDDVDLLKFIRNTQSLGFTLKEIRNLIDIKQTNNACHKIRNQLQDKLADILFQQKQLVSIELQINEYLDLCISQHDGNQLCPLLNQLEGSTEHKEWKEREAALEHE